MKSKRSVCLILVFVMLFSLGACSGKQEDALSQTANAQSLYDHGLEVVSMLVEATRTEEYVKLFIQDEGVITLASEIGAGDYESLKTVYSISLDERDYLDLIGVEGMDNLSEQLQENLENRILSGVATQFNSRKGVAAVAATSVLTMGKMFVEEGLQENIIYLYTYEDAFPVAVVFVVGEDGAVSASGTFILCEEEEMATVEDIERLFIGMDIVVNEITIE